ncbi:MAG: carbon monoxide dehydrogenase [Deltaproteobacteria bacterium]|nr:MAG: carbon monoxide dehydrogenase [Deltaproteobacteria bacterium]
MILEGKFKLKAPIQKVWDALLEPSTLASCVPGAEKIEKVDEKTYDCVVKQKVGPISVKFKFKTILTNQQPPNHIEFEGEGDDIAKAGHFVQKSWVDLQETPDGEVEVSYKTEVNIVGKLATFGDRIMRAKAKKVEEQFTKALQEKLESLT